MFKTIEKQIESELFEIQDLMEIGSKEGYKFENGKAIFGTRVGPSHSITDGLLHEIAHTAELKDLKKLEILNFGLEIKTKVELFGKTYYEPITWNATKLECRVILWQEVLCEIFDLKFDREKFATALQYMPDFLNVPLWGGYKFDSDKSGYFNSLGEQLAGGLKAYDELRYKSIFEYMNEQKQTGLYTYSEFRKRWNKVLLHLESSL